MKRTFTLFFVSVFLCIGTWAQSVAYKVAETQLASSALNEKTEATMIAIKNLSATNNYYYVGNTGSAPYSKAEFNNNGEAVFVWEPVTEGTAGSYYLRKLDGTYMQKSAPKDFGTIDNAAVFTTTNPTSAGDGSTKFNGDGDSQAYINGNDDPNLVRFVNGDGKWINVQNGASGTPLYNTGLGGWTIHYVYAIETGEALDVIYKFTYEGEEKYTQTTSTLVGEEWPAITVAFPYGVSASKPEGVVEAEKAAPTTFYVKNALSGQYLSYDVASNLTAADGEAVATIVPSSVVAGTFAVSYPGPNGAADPRFVQCGSKGRFSGNAQLTENSSVYLYKVTGEGAATRVNAVEDGASYVFVAKCSKAGYEGYWMVTNELFGEGADLRMIGVKVSDELADEITFEVGDYSPVWTVGVAEVEEVEAAEFYVKNAASGKYLDFDPASNLTTGDAEAVATISPSSLVAGTFGISYPDPTGQTGVRYVQCGSYGRFSGNSQLTKNSSIYLYKVTGEGAASRVEAIEAGASYIFVAECSKSGYEGYWMLTNETTGEGDALRMIGVKVSDELPGDEITFEQGEYSPVWTIKPVEKEEETVAITKVIELEVGELPFEAAETVEGITQWYYAKLHSNTPKYIQALENDTIECADTEVVAGEEDSHLWAFVGNVWSMKMVNKTGKAIVSTGGIAKLGDTANATDFTVMPSKASAEGFCMQYSNKSYLNGPQNSIVQSWADNDAGSTFLLEEYVEVAALTVLGAKVGDVDIVDGTATVSSISTIDVIFDRPVALAENAGWATVTDEWGENSLKAEVLAENNCVVRFSLQWGLVIAEEGDFPFYVPEGLIIGAEDANYINAEITATITVEAAPATPLTVTNVTVGEDVMEGFTAVATPEDMIKVNFDGQFYFQGTPAIVDAEGNDATGSFDFMNGIDVDGSNSYIFMGKKAGIYTITLAKASFMEMMQWKAPAEDIVLTVQIIAGGEFVEVTEVSLNTTWGELNEVGATLQLTATVTPENATEQAITWSSSHPDIVTVSEDGLVTVVAAAMEQVEIKATAANGVSASCWLTVYVIEPGAVTGIKLNATWKDLEVKSGDTFQLVATVEPEDATDKTVTWSSSADFAVVDANGLVTFTGTPEDGGVVTITATASNGMTATCMLSVTFVDNADGIDNINADAETVIYDIHGRRVTEMTKGVYIVNGKKVIKK